MWKKPPVFLRNENIDVITMLYSWLLNVSSVYSCWSHDKVYVLDKEAGADMKHNIVRLRDWVCLCVVFSCVLLIYDFDLISVWLCIVKIL